MSCFKQNTSQPYVEYRVLRAVLRFLFLAGGSVSRIIRRLGFILHGFNAGTFAGAVLGDPRMQRGTVDPALG